MMLINLTLSSEYEAVGGFIAYQLVSDFFRITTYVIGFLIVAKSATMLYVIVEILQGVIFYSISVKLINNNMGIQGVFLGGLIMNIIYFILVMSGFLYWRIQARGATKTNQETGG
jgi:PST family polysaccharide transporter/antigen flippase